MSFSPFFALPATALPIRLLLGAHIATGTMALLAGVVPMLGRKGGLLHVRAGRVYVYCMMVVALTAVLLCLFQPLSVGRLFLTGIAMLSFYLSFSGWRAARRHTTLLPLPDRLLAVAAALTGLAMLVVGIQLQAVLFAFFGGLICVFAGRDIKESLRPALAPTPWLLRHFTRLGGSYISAFTAFIVVNLGRWLPAGVPTWLGMVGWLAPTFIGTLLIFRTVRRYRARRAALSSLVVLALLPALLPPSTVQAQLAPARQLTIKARSLDTVRIGNGHYRTRLQTNFALSGQPGLNAGSEIGRVFQLPNRDAWLEEFGFVLSGHNFDTVQLRINLYQLRNGVPYEPLLRQPLYQLIAPPAPAGYA